MNHWHPDAQPYLLAENYPQLAAYYETLIENNPDEIDHYWYLGLAYLLQGKEADAQLTWLSVLNHQDIAADGDQYLQDLITVMETEATRLAVKEINTLAWLVRGHVRELQPDNLVNLMELLCLEVSLNYAVNETLANSGVITLLAQETQPKLPDTVITKTLEKVLYIVCEESVEFARACLHHSQNSPAIVTAIADVAKQLNFLRNLTTYPADLINACRETNSDDLALIKTLFVFYGDNFEYYDQALEIAKEFLTKSQTISTHVFGLRQLLYLYLRNFNWNESIEVLQLYTEEIIKFADQKHLKLEGFIANLLPSIPPFLLSFQDKLSINRYIFNRFNENFQDITINLGAIGYQHKSHSNTLTLDRPLRIGYIGYTFRRHSVGWLCRWLIEYQDINNFEVFIYFLKSHVDDITEDWFVKNSKKFYNYSSNTFYEDIVPQIRNDAIDILVDLDSVTSISTCEVMVHKPAPIQLTWLGLDASGIPAIDYFIADPYVLPDNAQDYYTEKIWRLPHTYLGIDGFEIGIPTLTRENLDIEKDAIIFMNIQGPLKLHPDILRLQLQIIKKVPRSYLLVKGNKDHRFLRKLYETLTADTGIGMDRLRFVGKTPTELEHRANLAIADVMLDTYPYNGATTTLETLWSEIPLVTKVGEQFAARNSYTFMINAGITEGIAWTDEEYIEWGIKLGTDENLRKEISWKLRQAKKTSPLWNGKQFARDMENAYRQMWEIYVDQHQTGQTDS